MQGATDSERWEALIRLLTPFHDQARATARRFCRSPADGDDLFQEAVLRAHAKLPLLRDETSFRSWFYAVLISVHRGRSRRPFWRRFLSLTALLASGVDPRGADGRHGEEERERAERASRALATLPAVQREAVVLHDIEGFSMSEIAAMQKVTVSAVKSRVARGHARLRAHYRRLGVDTRSGRAAMVAAQPSWETSPSTVRRESS